MLNILYSPVFSIGFIMPSATPATTIRLSEETRSQVDKFAKLTRRSRSFVIQEAVETYIHDRLQYLEELASAVDDAKSGYGHSQKQVNAWLDSWGTDSELPTPSPDLTPSSK